MEIEASGKGASMVAADEWTRGCSEPENRNQRSRCVRQRFDCVGEGENETRGKRTLAALPPGIASA